ncbi:MAG: hypothetical protein AAB466_07505 [Verrucomicrobiota bacterium]
MAFWGARASRAHWLASRQPNDSLVSLTVPLGLRAGEALGGTPRAATETVALPLSLLLVFGQAMTMKAKGNEFRAPFRCGGAGLVPGLK